jgi:hypothetical protein
VQRELSLLFPNQTPLLIAQFSFSVFLSLLVFNFDFAIIMSVDVISPSFSFRSQRKRQKVGGGSSNFRTPLGLSSYHNCKPSSNRTTVQKYPHLRRNCFKHLVTPDFEPVPATPFNTTQYLMNLHLHSPMPTVFVASVDKDNPNVELSVPLEQYGSMMETFAHSEI